MKRTSTLTLYEYQQKVFYIFISALFLALSVYAYLLNETIRNVVFVDLNQRKMADLRSNLGVLENLYLAKDKEITLVKAHELGFVDDTTPVYLSGSSLTSTLTLNTDAQ